MKPLLIAGGLLGLALCLVLVWKRPGEGGGGALERAVDEVVVAESASELPAPDAPVLAPERTAPGVVEPAPAARESARILGSFRLPDGAPASDVSIALEGWRTSPAPSATGAEDVPWEDMISTTGADGSLELELAPPPGFHFRLVASLPGYVPWQITWNTIEPGEELQLGEVTLDIAGVLLVRVEDGMGEPVQSEWIVSAPTQWRHNASAWTDPHTGVARFEGLAAGEIELSARPSSRITGPVKKPGVEVVAGREVEVTIRYEGPDPARRIRVTVFNGPVSVLRPGEDSVRLSGAGIVSRGPTPVERPRQSYDFDVLGPGWYTVSIEHPMFEPWQSEAVEPGTRVVAHLRLAAALRVAVVDAETGQALTDATLRLRLDERRGSPNRFELAPDEEDTSGAAVYRVPPLVSTLLVQAPGYSELELPLGEMRRGETRELVAQMIRGASLRGRVVAFDGVTPVAGAPVQLVPVGTPVRFRRPNMGGTAEAPIQLFMSETDERGEFEFCPVPAGSFELHVIASDWCVAKLDGIEVTDGEQREVQVTLPASGSLRGRFLVPDGARIEDVQLVLRRRDASWTTVAGGRGEMRLSLGADGSFVSGPLPPGIVAACWSGPEVMLPNSFGSEGAKVPEHELANLEVIAGVETEVELDARPSWPGSIRVLVTRDGEPQADHVVIAFERGRPRSSFSGAVTGPDGYATIEFLFAADWELEVRSIRGRWFQRHSGAVPVVSGRESRASIEVQLATGSLVLVDKADGEPLRERDAWVLISERSWQYLETDTQGRVELELAVGTYGLSLVRAAAFDGFAAQLEWTPDGPIEERLELEVPSDEE